MNIPFSHLLPSRFRLPGRRRAKPAGRIVVVFWDREAINYLIVSAKSDRIRGSDLGRIPHADQPTPLAALAEYFRQQEISVHQLVVLLARPDVDVLTLELPPADEAELPALVASEVEQQLGESENPPVVDYLARPARSEEDDELAPPGQPLLAFALAAASLESLRTDAAQHGFYLGAIGFRQLAALAPLRRQSPGRPRLDLAVQLYPGEIELALCVAGKPLLLRSLRANWEDAERVAELLLIETSRCLTLVSPETEELARHWWIDGPADVAHSVAQHLRQRDQQHVDLVDAASGWQFAASAATSPATTASPLTETAADASAGDAALQTGDLAHWLPSALTGAARDYLQGSLPINWIDPKRPPPPPNPWIRPAAMGAGGLAAAGVAAFVMMGDVRELREEAERLQGEVAEATTLQARLQERSDQVALIDNWLADQVDWLNVLSEVSQRLPDGQNATVRRLSAATGGNQGFFDLSVQVRHPDDIADLENRLRSVKYAASSKRISQSPEASEYPWRFETRITFDIEPGSSRQYGPTIAAPETDAPPPADILAAPADELTRASESALPAETLQDAARDSDAFSPPATSTAPTAPELTESPEVTASRPEGARQ